MLGQNPVERYRHADPGTSLDVVDVFSTIQGEGPYAGVPATFVRLAGCHLRCTFCDTDFLLNRRDERLDDLVACIRLLHNSLVVLTGGEPLRQNVVPLATALYANHIAQVETAGHFWWPGLEKVAQIVVSPKTPVVHDKVREHACAWKYIILPGTQVDPEDGLPCDSTQPGILQTQRLARPPVGFPKSSVYIQPCDMGDPILNELSRGRAVGICLKHGYRLSLQLHKILGMP